MINAPASAALPPTLFLDELTSVRVEISDKRGMVEVTSEALWFCTFAIFVRLVKMYQHSLLHFNDCLGIHGCFLCTS